jgi:IrrE N-terminal-like domain
VSDQELDQLILDRIEVAEAGAAPSALAAAIHAQLHDQTGAVPVHAIAKALDIVEIREEPTTSFEGALVMPPDRGFGSIVVNSRSSRERRRFTIAHELGHFLNIWHRPTQPNGTFACRIQDLSQSWSVRNSDQDRHKVQESEANRFAIELLAPRSRLQPFLKGIPDLGHVVTIAGRLELSREASARRYIELREEALALVFSLDGIVRYADRGHSFPFLGLSKGDKMPSVPPARGDDTITHHEEADPRDWGMRPNGESLVVQTLHQNAGFAITLLALESNDEDDS